MSQADNRTRLHQIITERSFRNDRSFKLASGIESNLYFNMKPTMMHAEGASLLSHLMLDLITENSADGKLPDYVAGLEMGAVPIVSAIAIRSLEAGTPIHSAFVRKQPKDYGAALQVEGLTMDETLEGKTVAVIDDVATTGGSMFKAMDAVAQAGGKVTIAAVIVDRQEGASKGFAGKGLDLLSLFKAEDFIPEGFVRLPPKAE